MERLGPMDLIIATKDILSDLENQKHRFLDLFYKSLSEYRKDLDLDVIREYYWSTDFDVKYLCNILNKDIHQLLSMIGHRYLSFPCPICGNTFSTPVKSRADLLKMSSRIKKSGTVCYKCYNIDPTLLLTFHPMTTECLRSMVYSEFLETDYWKAIRAYLLRLYDYECNSCGSKENLQIHHLTYARRGYESLSCLDVLCGSCHKKIHRAGVQV